ncbi:14 kDa proline-rich protein DC2.15-like [Primulina tabacum]|uniref:14 kDa proline-rich protein DC2.15-like n=1 Tax=Primulina tabacum TaxID=48773 RepID=UPI003F5A1798
MATSKISATVSILSLLLFAFFTTISAECPPKTKPIIPKPKPKPKPIPLPKGPPANPFCPRDTLKLGVCGNLLGVVNIIIGIPPESKCCALLEGLTDLEVAACLCTAIKANVLGINLNIPVSLSAIVTSCGKKVPTGFKCG